MGGGEGGQGHLVGLWVPLKKILATPLNSEPKKNMMKNKYPANNSNSSNLQVTIPRVSISVLKGRPKRKSGRLRDFCVPLSPLYFLFFSFFSFSFNGPEKLCVAFTCIPHNIYGKFYRKVFIFFEDRHRKANDNLFRY